MRDVVAVAGVGDLRPLQLTAKEIVHSIVEAVDAHRAGFPPNDDTTVVVLKFTLPAIA